VVSVNNPQLTMSLEMAVGEVLNILTGLDLAYDPDYDRFRTIARALDRAQRANALEVEWSWYDGVISLGTSTEGQTSANVPTYARPRMTGDDAMRLVNENDQIVRWAYYLPRDAIHKYGHRDGLWVAINREILVFSRGLWSSEADLDIQITRWRRSTPTCSTSRSTLATPT
jgi:hypothetical protein